MIKISCSLCNHFDVQFALIILSIEGKMIKDGNGKTFKK